MRGFLVSQILFVNFLVYGLGFTVYSFWVAVLVFWIKKKLPEMTASRRVYLLIRANEQASRVISNL